MKSLNISSIVVTLVALVGYILLQCNVEAGTTIFETAVIIVVGICLINAFAHISAKRLSSGASMYCVLLLFLFMMFKTKGYEGAIPLFYSGISFFIFAIGAKTIAVKRARAQGVPMTRFDFAMSYAVVVTVLSAIVFAA